ncbi:MAG: hypothetical protein ABFD52_02325 [Acidobacteriota bacterium]
MIQEAEKGSLLASLRAVEKWVEDHDYKAYEPFDGLSSRLRPLTFHNYFAERVLQQVFKRSPVNIRPLFGVKPLESTKGRGYMAWGYLTMYRLSGDESYKARAVRELDWLDRNRSPFYDHHSWGNHFDFSGRKVRTKVHEPIIVWTSLIGQAYLDAYELLKDPRYRDISLSICEWILGLPRESTPEGICLSYVAFDQSTVHNSNMLGAAMLARTGALFGRNDLMAVARQAMDYACAHQRPDGSWFYAESANCHWIDNYHTGYNLDSLKCYIDATADARYAGALDRGLAFYLAHFFEPDGAPRYYHDRRYPIESQCAAQAIDTLATFSPGRPECLALALRTAQWTIAHMQAPDGHFYYQKLPYATNRTPMLHWGQATTYKALANLLTRI